ncbi:MAG: hypothetical protein U0572_02345 [Phycisphaerales bacterium]
MTEHRLDILISRIVDKVESPQEWSEFRSLAATEPSAWELLAEAQRDHERLVVLAREATDVALDVALPLDGAAHDGPYPFPTGRPARTAWAGAGWAAAAALLLAWIATGRAGVTSTNGTQTAGPSLASPLTADDAFSKYIDRGRADGIVVGEIDPKLLLSTTPLPQGGFEVVFVRSVVERREVPTLVQFRGVDENGQAKAQVARPTFPNPM